MSTNNTSIYDIALHSYPRRLMEHNHRPAATSQQDVVVKWCAVLALLAMSALVPVLLVAAVALALFWPVARKPRHNINNNDPLDFRAQARGPTVPSLDMHMQDVAHRLAYMQHRYRC